MKKPDRRIRKTRAALLNALLSLMNKTAWKDISVQNICDKADVARSSFYSHFENKRNLLDEGFFQTFQNAAQTTNDRNLASKHQFAFLPDLLNHIYAGQQGFRLNENDETTQMLLVRFKGMVFSLAEKEIAGSNIVAQIGTNQCQFLIGGISSMIENWCLGQCKESPNTLIDRLDNATSSFISGATATVP